MTTSACIVIAFLMMVILVLLAFISRRIPINAIPTWRIAHRYLSVQLAALAGLLDSAALLVDQINAMVKDLAGVDGAAAFTQTHEYRTLALCVTVAGILARYWQQGRRTLGAAATQQQTPPAAP